MQRSKGGRFGRVSSWYRSSKMGQAVSGSWAPRRARSEREMRGGRGMGRAVWAGGWERVRDWRMGFAREMALRREAV